MEEQTIIQYINSRFKKIQDAVNTAAITDRLEPIDLLDNNIIIKSIGTNLLEYNIPALKEKINTSNTLTDPNNRYITDKQLEELNNKIGSVEFDSAVKELNNNFKLLLNKQLDNILNSKDIINAINDIKLVISENEDILDLFKYLVSVDELNNHINSLSHLNDDDRVALNLLLKFIDKGCADWDADESEPNYIRNKPRALPADGGDAATLGGYCYHKLINKQPESYIIGIDTANTYTKDQVTLILNNDNVTKMDEHFLPNTAISIREGNYTPKTFNMNSGNTISGVGNGTNTINCDVSISDNCILEKMWISDSNVNIICHDSTIRDITFNNCDITIDTNKCIIKDCKFNGCTFKFINSYNSIITNNICALGTKEIKFLGGNNIIKDNIKA